VQEQKNGAIIVELCDLHRATKRPIISATLNIGETERGFREAPWKVAALGVQLSDKQALRNER